MNEKIIEKSPNKKITFWYLLFMFCLLLWIIFIILAPLLAEVFPNISIFIYKLFSPVCHQIDERSFHIAGHKLAVCSRCFSIYIGLLISSIIYPFIFNLKKLVFPNVFFIIIPSILLALDFFLDYAGILKNTILTRSITGFLFGFGFAIFIIPTLINFILELQGYFYNKNNNK